MHLFSAFCLCEQAAGQRDRDRTSQWFGPAWYCLLVYCITHAVNCQTHAMKWTVSLLNECPNSAFHSSGNTAIVISVLCSTVGRCERRCFGKVEALAFWLMPVLLPFELAFAKCSSCVAYKLRYTNPLLLSGDVNIPAFIHCNKNRPMIFNATDVL
jgi:hypothetical protein